MQSPLGKKMKTGSKWLLKGGNFSFLYSASIVYIQVIDLELTNLYFGNAMRVTQADTSFR